MTMCQTYKLLFQMRKLVAFGRERVLMGIREAGLFIRPFLLQSLYVLCFFFGERLQLGLVGLHQCQFALSERFQLLFDLLVLILKDMKTGSCTLVLLQSQHEK
jgi:hypothetical protein